MIKFPLLGFACGECGCVFCQLNLELCKHDAEICCNKEGDKPYIKPILVEIKEFRRE